MNAETFDPAIRRYIYNTFLMQQRPPTVAESAEYFNVTTDEMEAAYQRLADAHIVVLQPGKTEIQFANPFSAVPTRFKVNAKGHSWWGTCAWDALGVLAALRANGEIVSSCPDCDEPIVLNGENGSVTGNGEVIHFAVPARKWWDDIFFT